MKRLGKSVGSLEAVAFIAGFSLMAFELVAARILAPTIGSSTYVWTSVIGVIIAALSLGYWMGGKLADKRHRYSDVVAICFIAAGSVVVMAIWYAPYLEWVAEASFDPRIQALMASILLFAPTSFVLGVLSPYLVKLNVTSLVTSGQSVANLSALNSIGGIAGTFITGFILFGYIGSRETLTVVVILLVAASWLVLPRRFLWKRVVLSLSLLSIMFIPYQQSQNIVRIDTPSAHYEIVKGVYKNQRITGLTTGPGGIQSAVYANGSSDLVFWYTQEIARIVKERAPRSVLMLGGGAFTLPQYLNKVSPDMKIDAVEIDPELEPIAVEYFGYTKPANVKLFFDDARAFLNKTNTRYDLIIVDVYGDNSIPFQLMTHEYGEEVTRHLATGGIVVANVIAGETNPACSQLLGAVNGAYSLQLPHVLYSTQSGTPEARTNYIVVYSKEKMAVSGMRSPQSSLSNRYADNYAPAERLHHNCQQESKY